MSRRSDQVRRRPADRPAPRDLRQSDGLEGRNRIYSAVHGAVSGSVGPGPVRCLASVGRVYVRVRVRRCASPAFTSVVHMNLLQMLGGCACVSGARSDP